MFLFLVVNNMGKRSKNFYESLDLNVGPRYVFFESLLNSPGP